MANIKSSKKDAKQSEKRRIQNAARRNELKSWTKKVQQALGEKDITLAQDMLKMATSKIARAKGKGVLKANTAARKVSRLARQVAAAARA